MASDRNDTLTLLAGIGIGAAIVYFLDPNRGARRRQLVGEQAMSTARSLGEQAHDIAVDTRNRTQGVAAELRGRMLEETVFADQLVARVRAELGRHVERARGIEVVVEGDTVTLRGPVLATELDDVVHAVSRVRGVARVNNMLDVRTTFGDAAPLGS